MSLVRMTFWDDVARGYGGSACPRKYGMNWFIPALVSKRPVSGGGISDDERTRVCPRSSKKRRKRSRISEPCTAVSLGWLEASARLLRVQSGEGDLLKTGISLDGDPEPPPALGFPN